jgi:hypothetical protein
MDEVTKTWKPLEDNRVLTHRTIPNTKIQIKTPHPYLRDRRIRYLVMVKGQWITDWRRYGVGPISEFKSLTSALEAAEKKIKND